MTQNTDPIQRGDSTSTGFKHRPYETHILTLPHAAEDSEQIVMHVQTPLTTF